MPRSDGTLYNWERDKLAKEAKAKEPKPEAKPVLKVLPDLPEKPKVDRRLNHGVRKFIAKLPKPDMRKRLDADTLASVLADIRLGLPVESALVSAGISSVSMARWRERNAALEIEFRKAESDFEREMLGNIRKHATSDAKASQWLLERRTASRWAPVSKTELTGKNGGPVQELAIAKHLLGKVAGEPLPGGNQVSPARSAKAS